MERFFLFIQRLFFVEIGNKLRPGSLKGLVDLLFVMSEKLGHHFDIVSNNYVDLYADVVKKEIELAKISPEDKILVIGAGSIPSTSIILAKETDAQIKSIDKDEQAAKKASQFIKKIKLQDKITIKSGNGINYPIKDYNVIFILYGVKQKSELLEYLSKNINNNTRVVYRETNDMENKINNEKIDLSKLFKIENTVVTKSFGTMNSYLLLKKV
jgi:precorrin-6B methylase 2